MKTNGLTLLLAFRYAAIFAFVAVMLTSTVACGDEEGDLIGGTTDYSALAVELLPTTDNDEVVYGNNRKEYMTTEFTEKELNEQLLSHFWNMTRNYGFENFIHDGTHYVHWIGTIDSSDHYLEYICFNQEWQDYAWPASIDAQIVSFYKTNTFFEATTQGRSVTINPAESKEYDATFLKRILPISRNQSFEVVGYNDSGMVVDFLPTEGDLQIINEINRKKSDDKKLDTSRARIRCFFPCMTREQYISAAVTANN